MNIYIFTQTNIVLMSAGLADYNDNDYYEYGYDYDII